MKYTNYVSINQGNHENEKHMQKSMAKKEALYKQTAYDEAANSIK